MIIRMDGDTPINDLVDRHLICDRFIGEYTVTYPCNCEKVKNLEKIVDVQEDLIAYLKATIETLDKKLEEK